MNETVFKPSPASRLRLDPRPRRMKYTSSAIPGAARLHQTECRGDYHARCHDNHPGSLFGLGLPEMTKTFWSF